MMDSLDEQIQGPSRQPITCPYAQVYKSREQHLKTSGNSLIGGYRKQAVTYRHRRLHSEHTTTSFPYTFPRDQ